MVEWGVCIFPLGGPVSSIVYVLRLWVGRFKHIGIGFGIYSSYFLSPARTGSRVVWQGGPRLCIQRQRKIWIKPVKSNRVRAIN